MIVYQAELKLIKGKAKELIALYKEHAPEIRILRPSIGARGKGFMVEIQCEDLMALEKWRKEFGAAHGAAFWPKFNECVESVQDWIMEVAE